jgi:hypothetical protein
MKTPQELNEIACRAIAAERLSWVLGLHKEMENAASQGRTGISKSFKSYLLSKEHRTWANSVAHELQEQGFEVSITDEGRATLPFLCVYW